MRAHDKLNKMEETFKFMVDRYSIQMGYGRMIQIIRYCWTNKLMEERAFKHLDNEKKELEASKRGSGETDWKLANIKILEKKLECAKRYVSSYAKSNIEVDYAMKNIEEIE